MVNDICNVSDAIINISFGWLLMLLAAFPTRFCVFLFLNPLIYQWVFFTQRFRPSFSNFLYYIKAKLLLLFNLYNFQRIILRLQSLNLLLC